MAVNRIKLLSEQVANQIAAGEVVERPASVVKELVENSLDAGASRVQVEIVAGGRSLIRVSDDGFGMNRDDALLCLERHATSKIRKAEDLHGIATMGFRGEAIPSIASVSQFVLTTRERDETSGEAVQVSIHGGKITEVRAAAHPPGTTVEVRHLFFNLPVRRKFLRTEETEKAHIQHYLTLVSLAHPHVGITFLSDQKTIWQLPPLPCTTPAEELQAVQSRWKQLLGSDIPMLGIDRTHDGPANVEPGEAARPLRVRGWIGAPGVSRSTREDQHLFVNRRPVDNRGLNFALLEGYHTSLMKGRYPVACLFVEIDPAEVDVNIHPSKREVKFRDEGFVRRFVSGVVQERLRVFHQPVLAAPPTTAATTSLMPAGSPAPVAEQGRLAIPQPDAPAAVRPLAPGILRSDLAMPRPDTVSRDFPPAKPNPFPVATSVERTGAESSPPGIPRDMAPVTSPVVGATLPAPVSGAVPVPLLHVPLRLVGVIGKLYVVLESDRGLVLMDQHAAHERVLFEQMLRRLEESGLAASQRLLLPETIELSARDAVFLKEQLPVLGRLGVGLTEFGDRTFLLDALPPMVKSGQPRQFVLELIDSMKAAGGGVNSMRLSEDVIAKTVCRHSVKANDTLAGKELESLIRELRHCQMPYTCPHGRPTLIEMNWRELERKFGRTG